MQYTCSACQDEFPCALTYEDHEIVGPPTKCPWGDYPAVWQWVITDDNREND